MRTLAMIAVLLTGCTPETSMSANDSGGQASRARPSLRVKGDRLFVPVVIAGTQAEALLDSGGEMTLVDADFASALSLQAEGSETARGTGGTAQVQFARGVDIESTGSRLEDLTVVIMDLTDISERLVGETVDLILGREIFDSGRFFLDIQDGRFEKVARGGDPEGVHLALSDHKGIKQFPVTVEGIEGVASDFDLGNGSGVLIGRSFAETNGLLSEGRIVGSGKGGGIGGEISRELIVLESLSFAGVQFESVEAAVDPTEEAPPLNIGPALLRSFTMTIDFPEDSLWLEPRR